MRNALVLVTTLGALAACGPARPTTMDSGVGRTDAPIATTDAPVARTDAPTSSDPCFAGMGAEALTTLGCNGGFPTNATPAMDTIGGGCTYDDANAQGSCGAGLICFSPGTGPMGTCLADCAPGDGYVSTSTCAAGTRCFNLGGDGLCFGDCDATHMCPTGQMCDGEGSCYFRM